MTPSTLLMIDGDSQRSQQRKEYLETLGYSVVATNSAPSAIAILKNTTVAAVLLEFKPKGISVEVAYHIKEGFPTQRIILLTTLPVPENVLWLVDDYIVQSDPPEALVKTIERFTRQRERDMIPKFTAA